MNCLHVDIVNCRQGRLKVLVNCSLVSQSKNYILGHSISNQLKMNIKKTTISDFVQTFLFHLLSEKHKMGIFIFWVESCKRYGSSNFDQSSTIFFIISKNLQNYFFVNNCSCLTIQL